MTPAAQGHAAMLVFSALVAGSFGLGALAANEIAPTALNAVRFWIATGVVGAVVLLRGGVPSSALAAPWRYVVLGGIFIFYFVMMFEGLKTAAPVSSAAVFTLTPIMAAGFGWILLRQQMTKRIALALGIGAVGALWVIFRADLGALLRFEVGRGEVIFFWGCLAHAVYTPLVRFLNRGETALVFTLGMLIAGSFVLSLWALPDLIATDWGALPQIVWITIGYTAIFASAMTFVLMQFASLRLPSAKVMAYTYLTPAWVILWDVALGGAWPPVAVAAGVALTAVAVVLLLGDDEAISQRKP